MTVTARGSRLPAPRAGRVRRHTRRSRAGMAVFAIAFLNALAWGLIVPPFHVPDETSHAFYAQYLGSPVLETSAIR